MIASDKLEKLGKTTDGIDAEDDIFQIFYCYGIHYPYDEHDNVMKYVPDIPLDRDFNQDEQKPAILRGIDDPDAPNHAFIYVRKTEDSGTYLNRPSSVANFQWANLRRIELLHHEELKKINKIYDNLIEIINPNSLYLGWSVYIARIPPKKENNKKVANLTDDELRASIIQ